MPGHLKIIRVRGTTDTLTVNMPTNSVHTTIELTPTSANDSTFILLQLSKDKQWQLIDGFNYVIIE